MDKFFQKHWLANNNQSEYLGSEKNPWTKRRYDYYFVNDESWAAVHGKEDHEYGSGKLTHDVMSAKELGWDWKKDFLFGIFRAKHFALIYLAFGIKPLCET